MVPSIVEIVGFSRKIHLYMNRIIIYGKTRFGFNIYCSCSKIIVFSHFRKDTIMNRIIIFSIQKR